MQSLTDNTLTANDAATVERATVTVRNTAQYRGLRPWQPGQSGNPKGRPNIGATLMDWTNVMDGWGEDRLRDVVRDKTAPVSRRAAARWLLDVATQDRTKGGTPVAAGELDRLLDRTLGKPVQQVTTTSTSVEFTFDLGRLDDAGEAIAALPEVQDQGEIEADSVGQADKGGTVSAVNMLPVLGDSRPADQTDSVDSQV